MAAAAIYQNKSLLCLSVQALPLVKEVGLMTCAKTLKTPINII